jgi:phage terminase small subunit
VTPKREKFCQEYLIDLNATQAAIRAGYSKKTASSMGEQLLRFLEVQNRISQLQRKRIERTEVTADHVINALARIANIDPRRMYDEDGQLIPANKLPDDIAMAVAGIEHGDKGGIKIKLNDRLKALELLGRHLAMFTDKVEASVKASGNVTIYLPENGREGTADDATNNQ